MISELSFTLFQCESACNSLSYGNLFIYMQILVHLHVNKTNFHMKGFTLGLALKQSRQKTTCKSPTNEITLICLVLTAAVVFVCCLLWCVCVCVCLGGRGPCNKLQVADLKNTNTNKGTHINCNSLHKTNLSEKK